MQNQDNRKLMNYASFSEQTRGRIFEEKFDDFRTVYQRDRDRILHSWAFRRLKHKTQVFFNEKNDYFRTRLTHTIEVSQIARSISYALKVNEDLAEAISLAHDLGHPPFGHAGEEVLNQKMKNFGGFNHNEQSLRIILLIENKYIEFNGLNLSWETVEGLIKHNGKINTPRPFIKHISNLNNIQLNTNTSIEGQIASIADDIAYISHDFDDGFNSGLLPIKLLNNLPIVGNLLNIIYKKIDNSSEQLIISEMIRKLISILIADIIGQAKEHLLILKPTNADDIRNYNIPVISFSDELLKDINILRNFLNDQMWRHKKVEKHRVIAKKILSSLFDNCISNEKFSNSDFIIKKNQYNYNEIHNERNIADYLANMTDNEARQIFKKISKN